MNIIRVIDSVGGGARVRAHIKEPGILIVEGPQVHHELKFICLTRPTAAEIEHASGAENLLVLSQPNSAAREAAKNTNHITLPNGGLRIVLPGLVLIAPEEPPGKQATTSQRLRGASGRIAESLLLGPGRNWLLRDLAQDAKVSLGLTQRVLDRLQRDGLVSDPHNDPRGRVVANAEALLKLWAQDNHESGEQFASGYVYSPNPMEAVRRIQAAVPGICIGGALAANSFAGRLSSVPAPYKIWVPQRTASPELLRGTEGLELATEGANLQFFVVNGDHWAVHAEEWDGAKRISKPRCYVELYESKGRLQELAEAVLESLR